MYKRFLIFAFVAMFAGGTTFAQTDEGEEKPPPEKIAIGDEAPEIKSAKWFNTRSEVTLEKLRGQVVCVEFWATWCGPCRAAHPKLSRLHNELNKKGFVLVSISNEPPDTVAAHLKEHKTPYIIGSGSKTGDEYGVCGIPAAFLLDTSGKVTWKGNPLDDKFEEAIKNQLKKTPPKKTGGLSDEDSKAALASAEKILKKKDYLKAMKAFEQVSADYPDTAAGKAAKKRLNEVKNDKTIKAELRTAEADKKCPSLLKLARDLNKNGKPDSARKYYQRIIDEYGDTSYAETARKELAELG